MATGSEQSSMLLGTLMVLTVVSGLVDAVSYLGLGHVFTANMTGNIAFLGFSLGGAAGFSVPTSLVALGAFLLGAMVGGRLVPTGAGAGRIRNTFLLQTAALTGATVLAVLTVASRGTSRLGLAALLAVGMGLQNAAVRRMAVADMTTTVLTMALTGLASDSSLAGGGNPGARRRAASVVLMLLGAAAGAGLKRLGLEWPVALATAGVLSATVLLASAA